MNHILTPDHFTGEYNIAQLGKDTVEEAVEGFIERYEPIALQEVFGASFYALLQAELDAATQQQPLSGRWATLVNGGTYYRGGQLFRWAGIGSVSDLCFLAAYVFYWWSRNEASYSSAVGEVKPKSSNAVAVSPVQRQTRVWNLFVGLAIRAREFVIYATDDSGNRLFPEMAGAYTYSQLQTINSFGI